MKGSGICELSVVVFREAFHHACRWMDPAAISRGISRNF